MIKKPFIPKNLKCLRCGYRWIQRVPGLPVACPKCKSYEWFKYKSSK